MKIGLFMTSRTVMQMLTFAIIFIWLPGSAAWGVFPPPTPTLPLKNIPVPFPPNLFQFVKDNNAAIKLGKALFWDMQVGSDGVQACASCHFHAGADNRLKNTSNPGADGIFQVRGPNQTLQPSDFPFHQRQAPVDFQASPVLRDYDDIVGSQGTRLTQFAGIIPGTAVESGTIIPDPMFNVNGVNTRRVTGRNTPSVINAVFNFANFWDGRANNSFNGENPFGPLDQSAGVWYVVNGTLLKQPVTIRNASLASQSTGPPLNETEMSFKGRTFPLLGRKMLGLPPLGTQIVHPADSVLGPFSKAVAQANGTLAGLGLNATYLQMVKDAFQDNLWNSVLLTPAGYTQMEANFSLFWGLAIQAYESTLVSDQTPFDSFLAGNTGALSTQQKLGFDIFFGSGRCYECHGGTELTNASVGAAQFLAVDNNALIQFMFVGNSLPGIYDEGFYNAGTRPTSDDIGRGGTAPFVNPLTGANFPLSFSLLAELQRLNKVPFPSPGISPPTVPSDIQAAVHGAFKTPGLRNVELTAPYFHNGGALTLEQVVEFYNRGGNYPILNMDDIHPAINQIDLLQFTTDRDTALVAFLKALTDERVRNEAAPFDHPELTIPNGEPENATTMLNLPATGAAGLAPLPPTSVTLTSNLAAPQPPGATVIFTAAAQGGNRLTEYRFWLNDGSGSGFVIKQAYSTMNSLTWTPTATGNYDIFVEVRNSGSTVVRDAYNAIFYYQVKATIPATGVTIGSNLTAPQKAGTPITFTATGQGGSGPYEYRFYLNDGTGAGFVVKQNYSTANVWTWTPAATGNYDIFVEARNVGSTALREAYQIIYFYQVQATAPVTAVNLGSSLVSPQKPGTPITFIANGQGGSGPYEYRFYLNSGAGFVLQGLGYSPTNTFTWTPAVVGNNDIFVEVRNVGSTANREAYNVLFFYQIK